MPEYVVKWLPQVLEVLMPLVLVLIAWASAEAARYIRSRSQSALVRDAIARLDDASAAIVSDMAQGLVASLKDAASDGKLTPEEIEHVREESRARLLGYLGASCTDELRKLFGSNAFDIMVKAKLEQALAGYKLGTPVGGSSDNKPA